MNPYYRKNPDDFANYRTLYDEAVRGCEGGVTEHADQ
jgi:hypothetical protein